MTRFVSIVALLPVTLAGCALSHDARGEDEGPRGDVVAPTDETPTEPDPAPGTGPAPRAPEMPRYECFDGVGTPRVPVEPYVEHAVGEIVAVEEHAVVLSDGHVRTRFEVPRGPMLAGRFTIGDEVELTRREGPTPDDALWMLIGPAATAYVVQRVEEVGLGPASSGPPAFEYGDLRVAFGEALCQVTDESSTYCDAGSYLRRNTVFELSVDTPDGHAVVGPGGVTAVGGWEVGYGRAVTYELLRACEGLGLAPSNHQLAVAAVGPPLP